jgi:hypothetical protein
MSARERSKWSCWNAKGSVLGRIILKLWRRETILPQFYWRLWTKCLAAKDKAASGGLLEGRGRWQKPH